MIAGRNDSALVEIVFTIANLVFGLPHQLIEHLVKGVRNGENVLSKKDLTPRERSTLLVLKHSPEPLSIRQLCEKTGYQSPQPFRASLRFLESERVITSSTDARGQEVYSLAQANEVS
jgi:hypothetical protein